MKKLKLFISLWFTMFSVAVFAQAEFEKIAITQNTLDNSAGRLIVQDATTGELKYILKSVLDNKFNQPTGNATQYLDGAGTPTAFPVLGQADRVITEVRNTTGATVVKGTVIYLSGASGGKATIQKAQANSELTSSGTFGVIQSDINNNSNGYAVVIGTVLGVNTSSYTEGQVLWLSPTVAGGFTSTKPVAPNHAVYVAIVTLAATNGTIEVKVQNGYEIDELHDVLITSKANNDAIVYDSASGLWKNKQLVADAITDGTTTVAPSQNAVFDALAAKENISSKNVANGYAGLGSDGKLFSTQLPSITITDTFVVGSQAAMLALTAETGDVAVRTDVNKSFILKGSDPAVLANWQELLTPTSAVTSVFGRNGAVTAQNGDYTTALVTETTNKRYQTDNQQTYNDATSSIQTQLNSKANDNTVVHLAGSESITGAKTFTATPSFDSNIYLKHLSGWGSPAGYTVIGGRTDGFLLSASSTKTALIGLSNLTQAWTYDFPNKSGTFAMTSDVPVISGTTNYIPKFTGASTLGNSLIFDDGSFVGIGVSSGLNRTLQIVGSTQISHKNTFSPNEMLMGQFDGSGNAAINNVANANLYFHTNNQRVMTLLANKNVGIDLNTPSSKLSVDGDIRLQSSTAAAKSLIFSSPASNWGPQDSSLKFIPADGVNAATSFTVNLWEGNGNSNEKMRITSSGNVGIGTGTTSISSGVSGSAKVLAIVDNTTTNVASFRAYGGGTATSIEMYGGAASIGLYGSTDTPMTFSTNNAERMRITSAGNVGIGMAPNSSKLTVNGAVTIGEFTNGTAYINANSGIAYFGNSDTSHTLGIYNNGNYYFTGLPVSDVRLKENIKDLTFNATEKVIALQPKSYYMKNDSKKIRYGFIAQEVNEILPDLINGDPKGKDFIGLDYNGVIPVLVKAIQEQQAQIKELQKEIEILKNK